jgi:hypothetical protein
VSSLALIYRESLHYLDINQTQKNTYMKTSHYLLIFGLISLSLFGCRKKELSSVIDQDRIYMDFYLSYNEKFNRTYPSAYFFVDDLRGKRVELSQNSRIFYGGAELNPATKKSVHYTGNLVGYVDSSQFVWNDTEGRTFSNTVGIPNQIYANTQSFGYWFSPFWGYDFYWEGDSVGVNETVEVQLRVDQDTTFTLRESTSTNGRRHVHFTRWDTELLMGRVAYVTVTRRRTKLIDEGTAAGGQITTNYVSEGSWLYGY